jgi:hypothetical protein
MYSTGTKIAQIVDEAFEPEFALVDALGHPLRTAKMSADEAEVVNEVFRRYSYPERWMECESRKAKGLRP